MTRSNRDLEQFAYIASHDLQEPLRSSTGFLQLLQRRYGDQLDEEANRYINLAVDGTKRMQTLVRDLLSYSRIGKNVVPFEPVDFNKVLDQVRLNLATAIQENKAKVRCKPLPVAPADFGQMVQLFQNLIGNAIKFKGTAPPQIDIAAHQVSRTETGLLPGTFPADQADRSVGTDQVWRFEVRDNGIGLDLEFADHIFTPFKRLHSRAKFEGSGIGLAICQKIVEGHKGRIWVTSEPDRGSTFVFTIPVIET